MIQNILASDCGIIHPASIKEPLQNDRKQHSEPWVAVSVYVRSPLRENADAPSIFRNQDHIRRKCNRQPIESVQFI